MQERTISVTEAARNFAEYVNRVRYLGLSFLLLKNGSPVARLIPEASPYGGSKKSEKKNPRYSSECLRRKFMQW